MQGIRTVLYTEVSPDPTVAEVEAAAECFFVSGCEAILAIGGGSVMDCAKVAGARTVRRDLPVGKMSGMLKIHKKLPLLLAVPTTAGTGSEVTLAASSRMRHATISMPSWITVSYRAMRFSILDLAVPCRRI